jgi:hypothetical protein
LQVYDVLARHRVRSDNYPIEGISKNVGSCQDLFWFFFAFRFFFRAHYSVHSEEWSYLLR